jgi:hypothetical protein
MRHISLQFLRPGLALLAILANHSAMATSIGGCDHLTDGLFNASATSITDATEWGCSTVSKSEFAQVGNAGGAFLYADQGGGLAPTGLGFGGTLYLMYDYVAGDPAAFSSPDSFFDVFFEVVPDGHAYLVRIPEVGQLLAFERPIGDIAPLTPDGSFDLGPSSGWMPLEADDLNLAQFQGAVGIGTSQNNPLPHPMAEFQLTINQPGHPGSGLYDPSPAFWSASAKAGGAGDPPISSGIFTLNPDGGTTVTPVLDPSGTPVMQGSAIPEPTTFGLFAAGLVGMCLARRRTASSILTQNPLLERKP